jgi:hypothetical protein
MKSDSDLRVMWKAERGETRQNIPDGRADPALATPLLSFLRRGDRRSENKKGTTKELKGTKGNPEKPIAEGESRGDERARVSITPFASVFGQFPVLT